MKAAHAAAALIDGTALYFRSRDGRSERLDYEALNEVLQAETDSAFNPAIFFTTYDAQNEGQAKFLNFIKTRLQWKAETRPVWDADPLPKDAPWERSERRSEFIRFDAPIAFALGRLVERRERIVVVTDSFGLEPPMSAAAEYRRTEIVLAFFGSQLDPRWLPVINGGDTKIQFVDLDQKSEALFGREPSSNKRGTSTLTQLD